MAYQFNAVAVSLENRWYGESMPGSLTDTQLLRGTLNVAVALEDLAVFMRWFRAQYLPPDTKWLVVGGSYSGALSAWMRQTYPDLVSASWSSSGVVHPTFDFNEYYGHVQDILDADCAKAVQEAATEFDLMYENEASRPALFQMLNIPASTPYGFLKADLQATLVSGIGGSVQYGFRSTHCNAVLAARRAGTDPLQAYADVTMDLWGSNYFSNCGASTECLTNVQFADQWAGAGVSWLFQTCIEMAFWQIGFPDSLMPVEVSSDYYMQQCRLAFGNATFPDVVSFNSFHGGLNVNNTTYVVAAQGSDDPWSTVGVRATLRPLYPARLAECADCGHCGDLFSPDASTPAQRIAQQQFINATLTAWFQQ
jgi:pimeloyl-ACP methyl ester carboxylesterase